MLTTNILQNNPENHNHKKHNVVSREDCESFYVSRGESQRKKLFFVINHPDRASFYKRESNNSGSVSDIRETANHFFPRSFREAPTRYTALSRTRKRSCDFLNSFTSIVGYCALCLVMSSWNCLGVGTLKYGGKHSNSMFSKSKHFGAASIISRGYHIL